MSAAARWCPACGVEANRTAARGVWVCRACLLSTDEPLESPRVTWTKVTVGFGGYQAEHAGHRLTVSRYGAGCWGWHLYRLDADNPRWIAQGDPVARGRAPEYRWAQRLAVGALAFTLAGAHDEVSTSS